jgi:hypothetical protein
MSRPPILMAMFVVWVSIPFAALLPGYRFSSPWALPTRLRLYIAMSVISLGSVAVYVYDAWKPRKAQAALVYVIIPPVSFLFAAASVLSGHVVSTRSRLQRI